MYIYTRYILNHIKKSPKILRVITKFHQNSFNSTYWYLLIDADRATEFICTMVRKCRRMGEFRDRLEFGGTEKNM